MLVTKMPFLTSYPLKSTLSCIDNQSITTPHPLHRYFARALNPGGGLEPSPREVAAIRQSRVETSKFLAELLEFAQTRLLEYARLVAVRGRDHDDDDDDDGGGFDGSGEALMGSCVWELQERG